MSKQIRCMKDYDFENKNVLLRCDFNVPIKNGKVLDEFKIKATIPTIKYLINAGARKIILCSHLGNPSKDEYGNYSLKILLNYLEKMLNVDIAFWDRDLVKDSMYRDAKIILMENLRFHDGEVENDREFSKKLSDIADVLVIDSFASLHRAHASIVGIQQNILSVAGLLVESELNNLDHILLDSSPITLVLGGGKPDKIEIITSFKDEKVKYILTGGVLANTFLKHRGFNLGRSKIYDGLFEDVNEIWRKFEDKILLPEDVVVEDLSKEWKVVDVDKLLEDHLIVDLGPKTIRKYSEIIENSRANIFGGPLGVIENESYSVGTENILKMLNNSDGRTIVLGGDSNLAVLKFCPINKFIVSTGGGASLFYLSNKILPGLEALKENYKIYKG